MIQCMDCGRFCKNVIAWFNGLDEIVKVEGNCKKCGHVDLTNSNWTYEQFQPPARGVPQGAGKESPAGRGERRK